MKDQSLHLIKLAVGCKTLRDLQYHQKQRYLEQALSHRALEISHVTRNFPKRSKELLEGGYLYWIISGHIRARQRIVELREINQQEQKMCGIMLDHEIIPTIPTKHRAFQGWRYFEAQQCPSDLGQGYSINVLSSLATELLEVDQSHPHLTSNSTTH